MVEKDTEKPETRTCANDARQCAPTPECGIWLAQSTIPESGLGLFAGKSFDNEEDLLETGDIVIPIVDFDLNQWRYCTVRQCRVFCAMMRCCRSSTLVYIGRVFVSSLCIVSCIILTLYTPSFQVSLQVYTVPFLLCAVCVSLLTLLSPFLLGIATSV